MNTVIVLSADQSDLIKRLIEFAENNDFFESEFDDEEERSYFAYSRIIANELERKLSLNEETNDVASGPAEQVATNWSITMVEGRPWWDLSNVRLLSPEQLHQQLQEIRDRLRTLMSHSDSLDVRQIILGAFYLLHSVDPHITIGNSGRSS
ncbi:MAG: hypothetical protein L0387_38730 [Acidobacteria bacterium]|nr:hypothetical protein [Acidobacteriota bacterium]